jgi:4-amino-4-deoxy-L-arabinose transferase-like glycosyltransferase
MQPTNLPPDQSATGRLGWADQAAFVVATVIVLLLRTHTLNEPLDCDEAAYSYVAHRLLQGDHLYADVFENKPPLAYAPYAAAISVGGYNERAIRLLPVPFAVITLWMLQQFARRAGGSVAGAVTAILYAVTSSDPFTFGNGANLELYVNGCLATALFCILRASDGTDTVRWVLLAGLAAGCAAAIKQVAIVFFAAFAIWLWIVRARGGFGGRAFMRSLAALVAGASIPWLVCLTFVAGQRVLAESYNAVFVYAPALATDAAAKLRQEFIQTEVLRISQQHPGLGRLLAEQPWLLSNWLFLTGNPQATAWWGAGIWPLLVLSGGGGIYLIVRKRRPTALVLGYTGAACLAICWPGLFWQHYYMLLLPGVVLLTGLAAAGLVSDIAEVAGSVGARSRVRGIIGVSALAGAAAVALVLFFVQWREYIRLTPEEITTRHKGGQQWVALREVATRLRLLPGLGPDPRIFIWGVQSPLHVYSQMDSVTPYFFTDPLMQQRSIDHPLAEAHQHRILADLQANKPLFVFIGERPFPALEQFVEQSYIPAGGPELQQRSGNRGLYMRRDAEKP